MGIGLYFSPGFVKFALDENKAGLSGLSVYERVSARHMSVPCESVF